MSIGENSGPIHPTPTRTSLYRYLFSNRHHGFDARASRWSLDRDEEFAVFDTADLHKLRDEEGRLYGVHKARMERFSPWGRKASKSPNSHSPEPTRSGTVTRSGR